MLIIGAGLTRARKGLDRSLIIGFIEDPRCLPPAEVVATSSSSVPAGRNRRSAQGEIPWPAGPSRRDHSRPYAGPVFPCPTPPSLIMIRVDLDEQHPGR